jgi:hypothetical protein
MKTDTYIREGRHMLFVERRKLGRAIDLTGRITLLEKLQQHDLIPVIRSARLHCFENALSGSERLAQIEPALAGWSDNASEEAFIRGDIFCRSDHVFFLVFDNETQEEPLLRGGIVYDDRTPEPFRKLDLFCRQVLDLLLSENDNATSSVSGNEDRPEWNQERAPVPQGFQRFVAKQDIDLLYTSLRKETMANRILAATMLEDAAARIFLRTAKDAHVEGYATKLLTGEVGPASDFSVEQLAVAGLVEREVQVSCRKTGHALFRLPTAHALAVVTVSEAMCSECGSPVADEVVQEVVVPTPLASSLLEEGSWLVSRLYQVLRELGIPESEIAIGPSQGQGDGQIIANICGESFLLVVRDGDLTPAFARRAIDLELETEASHLVIVATGRVHNQSRVLLNEHARRRVMAGSDFEMILANTADVAGREVRLACERVSERVLAEQLCDLDGNIGLNVSRLIIMKFRMLERQDVERSDNVESAQSSSATRQLALAAHPFGTANPPIIPEILVDDPGAEVNHTESEGPEINSGIYG